MNENNIQLSTMQKEIYYAWQKTPESTAYVLTFHFKLDGKLNIEKLSNAINKICEIYPILWSKIQEREVPPRIKTKQLKGPVLKILNSNKNLNHFIYKPLSNKLDLSEYILIKNSQRSFDLVIRWNHLIADGPRVKHYLKTISDLYNEKLDLSIPVVSSSKIKVTPTIKIEKIKEIYAEILADNADSPKIQQFERNDVQKSKRKRTVYFSLSKKITKELHKFSINQKSTDFIVLFTIFGALISRYSFEKTFAIGYTCNTNLNETSGYFVNTIPMAFNFSVNDTWEKALTFSKEIRKKTKLIQNEAFSKVGIESNFAEIIFNQYTLTTFFLELNGLKSNIVKHPGGSVKNSLTLYYVESDKEIFFECEYDVDKFTEKYIEDFTKSYLTLLKFCLKDTTLNIQDISLAKFPKVSGSVNKRIPFKNLLDPFVLTKNSKPNNLAVLTENESITYLELDNLSNKISNHLITYDIKPKSLIAIKIEKSIMQIATVIAILKLGCIFVPIDTELPNESLKKILEENNVRYLVTDKITPLTTFCTSILLNNVDNYNSMFKAIKYNDIAYVIFTSGSTGEPKGVVMEHAAVLNTITEMNRIINLKKSDKIFSISKLSFDLSIYDIFGTFMAGASIVLPSPTQAYSPTHWVTLYKRFEFSIWNSTPALAELFFDSQDYSKLNKLKTCLLSGDWIPLRLPKKISHLEKRVRILSLGGATEAGIWSIYYPITKIDNTWTSIPYGKSLPYQSIYVLDERLHLLPEGAKGKIFIGGGSLAKEYLNSKDLTSKRFLIHQTLGRLYDTGDLGRYRNDGNIEILGRSEVTTKFRGRFINPANIVKTFETHPDIEKALLLLSDNGKQLNVYLLKKKPITIENIFNFCSKNLEAYQIPTKFFIIDSFPITQNGKIDYKKLAALKNHESSINLNHKIDRPKTDTEKRLWDSWKSILRKQNVTLNDNFFQLGGSSLQALECISIINAQLNTSIPLNIIFQNPTIKLLAERIDEYSNSYQNLPVTKIKSRVQATPEQTYFLLAQEFSDNKLLYFIPSIFQIEEKFNETFFSETINELIFRHDALKLKILKLDKSFWLELPKDEKPTPIFINNLWLSTANWLDKSLQTAEHNNLLLSFHVRKTIDTKSWDVLILIHHCIADGWSIENAINEIATIYKAKLKNNSYALPPAPSFLNFANRINNLFKTISLKKFIYWENTVKEASRVNFPLAKVRPETLSNYGFTIKRVVSNKVYNELKILSQTKHTSLAVMLNAAFSWWIHNTTKNDSFLMANNITDRVTKEDEHLIGLCMHTQLTLCKVSQGKDFYEYANDFYDSYKKSMENYIPIAMFAGKISTARFSNRNTFSDILFSYQEISPRSNYSAKKIKFDYLFSKFDLSLYVNHLDGLELDFEFSADLFEKHYADALVEDFLLTLNNLRLQTSNKYVSHYVQGDESTLLYSSIKNYSDKIAVSDNNASVSYSDFGARINSISNHLKDLGIAKNMRVAVLLNRDVNLPAIIFSLINLQVTFVPLDIKWPESYIKKILLNVNPSAALTNLQLSSDLFSNTNLIMLDDKFFENVKINSDTKVTPIILPHTSNNAAYIIFTSGSTGDPKGVVISYKSLFHSLINLWSTLELKYTDTIAAISTISFDISLFELLAPLLFGSSIEIISKEIVQDGKLLAEYLDNRKITVLQATPSTLKQLVNSNWKNKNDAKILSGGEPLENSLFSKLLKISSSVWNLYGPTEATIWISCSKLSKNANYVHIGKPIYGNIFKLLTDENEITDSEGKKGELLLCGENLALGYWLDEKQTTQKFRIIDGVRYYHSGDLVEINSEGKWVFLSRKDRQVKIRGHRIDLGFIEKVTQQSYGVEDCAATVTVDTDNNNTLNLYVIRKPVITKKSIDLSLFFFDAYEKDASSYSFYLECAKIADTNNLTAIWTPERHFDNVAGRFPNPAILSSAIAMVTDKIKIRAGSVVSPLHQTVRIAEEWAMVDQLSNGRAGLSLASGWHPQDFILAPKNYENRKLMMFEQLKQLRTLWSGDSILEKDHKDNMISIKTYPQPKQNQIPIWITAAANPETFAEAGKHGVNILTHLLNQTREDLAKSIDIYKVELQKSGHNPAEFTVTLMIHTFVAETDEEAISKASEALRSYLLEHINLLNKTSNVQLENKNPDSEIESFIDNVVKRFLSEASLIGSPETVRNIIGKFNQVGVNEFACLVDFGLPKETILSHLSLLNSIAETGNTDLINSNQLIDNIRTKLPEYMLPNNIKFVESFPLHQSNKINYSALDGKSQHIQNQTSNELLSLEEKTVGHFWETALGHKKFTTKDSFFSVGGHSLLATILVEKISAHYQVKMLLSDIFINQTIERQVQFIKNKNRLNETNTTTKLQFPVSITQKRIWILSQIEPNSPRYNDYFTIGIEGKINFELIKKSITKIVERNSILMATFFEKDENVFHKINKEKTIEIEHKIIDEDRLDVELKNAAKIRFKTNSYPLYKIIVFQHSVEKFSVFLCFHHLLMDGWSIKLFINSFHEELSQECSLKNQADSVPMKSFSDFVEWQDSYLKSEKIEKSLLYWEMYLQNLPKPKDFCWNSSRPPINGHQGERCYFNIPERLIEKLTELSLIEKSSIFSILLLVFGRLINTYTSSSEVLVGVPFANRINPEFNNIIGCFMNVLPIRINSKDTILTCNDMIRETLKHQDTPFEKIITRINPQRDTSRNPLFDYLFVYDNIPIDRISSSNLSFSLPKANYEVSRYDLSLFISDNNWRKFKNCFIEYNSSLFSKDFINIFIKNYIDLLSNIDLNNDIYFSLSDIKYLKGIDIDLSLNELPLNRLVNIATTSPEKPAIKDQTKTLSYKEFISYVSFIASALKTLNIRKGDIVAVLLDASIDQASLIYAIWQLGAVYMPISTTLPLLRINKMLDISKPKVLVLENEKIDIDEQFLAIDFEKLKTFASPQKNIFRSKIQLSDPAYLIFTSGTTGQPKANVLPHYTLTNLLKWHELYVPKLKSCTTLADIGFDVALQEVVTSLSLGLFACVAPSKLKLDVSRLMHFVIENEIELLFLPTALLNYFVNEMERVSKSISLKYIIIAGEKFIALSDILESLEKRKIKLINQYGPCETHVVTSCFVSSDISSETLSTIGNPITNVDIIVLNDENEEKFNLLYVPGEICVSSKCIGSPLFGEYKKIKIRNRLYYRTGDFGFIDNSDRLFYLSRNDDQVKLRGYRIELSTIEYTLNKCDSIKSSAVILDQKRKVLIAFVELNGTTLNEKEIKSHLKQFLPDYMTPHFIYSINKLPLTTNGKIDREILLQNALKFLVNQDIRKNEDLNGSSILAIFKKILNQPQLSGHENFFEVGGDSLKAIGLVHELKKHGFMIEPIYLYRYASINEIINFISSQGG